jgi:hypothetical protein
MHPMPLPDADDTRRPLFLAARIMSVIGGLFIAFGIVLLLLLLRPLTAGNLDWFIMIVLAAVPAFFIIAGIMLVVFGGLIRRGMRWAIVVSIVLASFLTLIAAFYAISPAAIRNGMSDQARAIQVLVSVTFLITLIKLLICLARSFRSLGHPEFRTRAERGFEPLLVKPVTPADVDATP